MGARLQIKRGTRAEIDTAAGASGLHQGEPYLITDEGRLAVGTGAGTYEEAAKLAEVRTTPTRSGGSTTLGLADAGGTYRATSAATVTIPANATTAFPVGTVIAVVSDTTGTVTITGATGVTLNGTSGGSVDIGARYGGASLQKWATDTWIASGDLA